MNGPEHYKAAEQFLDIAADLDPGDPEEVSNIAAAQAHATLALAAATALAAIVDAAPGLPALTMMPTADAKAWQAVAGVAKK